MRNYLGLRKQSVKSKRGPANGSKSQPPTRACWSIYRQTLRLQRRHGEQDPQHAHVMFSDAFAECSQARLGYFGPPASKYEGSSSLPLVAKDRPPGVMKCGMLRLSIAAASSATIGHSIPGCSFARAS